MRWLLCLITLSFATPGMADEIATAAEKLAFAETLMQSAESSEDRGQALSEAIGAYEEAITSLYDIARSTAAKERQLARDLEARQADHGRILSALMRLQGKTDALLALGNDPVALSHTALLLDRVQRAGADEIRDLSTDIETLKQLRSLQSDLRARLTTTHQALSAARNNLGGWADNLPEVGVDAANLVLLAIALEGLPNPDVATVPRETKMPAPVPGATVSVPFGPRPGLTLSAPAGALVTSPESATIRFAGHMDGYGKVVIAEPAPEQLLVFAGLERLLVRAGMNVNPGRGLGFLPGKPILHEEFLKNLDQETSVTDDETLYIETRVDGNPVDPALLFAFEN